MTKRGIKKTVSTILTVAMTVGVLASCGGGGGTQKSAAPGEKVTYWAPMSSVASTIHKNWADMPLYKKIMENTGIDVDFIHPSSAGAREQFSILLASEQLPDIIQYNWSAYPGGPGKAIKDGVIIDLNKHKDKFPNLMKFLEENEDIRRNCTTNDGELFAVPFIRGDQELCVTAGMAVRKDWLDDLGLEPPETIDEWETMLERFKNEKGAESPACIWIESLANGMFSGAYNTIYGYYLRDGKVTHGMLDDSFKDLLLKLNDWYNRGLIEKDFTTIDSKTFDANILNGKTGAMQLAIGGGIGKFLSAAPDDKFDLIGVKSPVMEKGTYPEFGFNQTQVPLAMNCSFTAITADCNQIDEVAKLLDYGYSEEGAMLYNFGIEGESYNMIEGYPTYTDDIKNNAEGKAMNLMMSEYCQSYDGGPFIQDRRYYEQYAGRPQQQAAWKTWSETNMLDHLIPNLFVSGESQTELASIDTSLNTYMTEHVAKLIMGTESFDNYDKIIEELKTRGIERAIEIRQEAYEEYLKR